MTEAEIEERKVTASWRPNVSDRKLLVRHIVQQQINRYLPSLAVPGIFAAGFDKLVHSIKPLSFLPEWWFLIGFCALMTVSHIIVSRRIVRRSTARLSRVVGLSMTSEVLTLRFEDEEDVEYESQRAFDRKRTADGIYFEIDERRMFIPIRAFASREDADIVENIIDVHSLTPRFTHYTPPPETGIFPISIAYEQIGADIVHAYYHGWSRSYLRSSEGSGALILSLAPVVIGGVPLMFVAGPAGVIFPLMITIALTIIVGLHTISPAFPVSVAGRRLPFKKPITVALGEMGVAIRVDEKEEIVLWKAVRKLAADERFIYIDMPDKFILIPKSIFLGDGHAEEYFAAATAYSRGEIPQIDSSKAAWPPVPQMR